MWEEWQSVEDSVLFWKTDLNDDPALKLALVDKIGELCVSTCMCPEEVHFRLSIYIKI